jgi:hypothetical protein
MIATCELEIKLLLSQVHCSNFSIPEHPDERQPRRHNFVFLSRSVTVLISLQRTILVCARDPPDSKVALKTEPS